MNCVSAGRTPWWFKAAARQMSSTGGLQDNRSAVLVRKKLFDFVHPRLTRRVAFVADHPATVIVALLTQLRSVEDRADGTVRSLQARHKFECG